MDYATGSYRGMVSGWGMTNMTSDSSPILKYIGVNVLSQAQCLRAHNNPRTNGRHVCVLETKGKGACSVSILFYLLDDTFKKDYVHVHIFSFFMSEKGMFTSH